MRNSNRSDTDPRASDVPRLKNRTINWLSSFCFPSSQSIGLKTDTLNWAPTARWCQQQGKLLTSVAAQFMRRFLTLAQLLTAKYSTYGKISIQTWIINATCRCCNWCPWVSTVFVYNLHLKLGNLENRGEAWLGRHGSEEICCNSQNTVSRDIASLIPRDNGNGSPGLTPGPDGDSVTGTLAILPPLPHIGLTLPHCQVPSIAKLCFDQFWW